MREADSGFRYAPNTTFEIFPFQMPPDGAKGRTLTQLYNEFPTWLEDAHRARALDPAVFDA